MLLSVHVSSVEFREIVPLQFLAFSASVLLWLRVLDRLQPNERIVCAFGQPSRVGPVEPLPMIIDTDCELIRKYFSIKEETNPESFADISRNHRKNLIEGFLFRTRGTFKLLRE